MNNSNSGQNRQRNHGSQNRQNKNFQKPRTNQTGQKRRRYNNSSNKPLRHNHHEYSAAEAEKFIGSPRKNYQATSVEAIDLIIKNKIKTVPKEVIEINEKRKVMLLKIEQAENKLRFSQSQPLEEDLNHLKKEDTKLLCQLVDLLA